MEKYKKNTGSLVKKIVYPKSIKNVYFATAPWRNKGFRVAYSTSTSYSESLYIGAITKGFVIATIPLKVEMKCGKEVLTPRFQNFFDLTATINTGTEVILTKAELEKFATTTTLFTSTISLTRCPIDQSTLAIEKHDPSVYKGTPAKDTVVNTESRQFKINPAGKLILRTDRFDKAGYYYADLVAHTIGGVEIRFPY